MKKTMRRFIPLIMMLSLAAPGCASQQAPEDGATAAVKSETVKKLMYKGKIVGKSNKAKQISMKVGKGAKAKAEKQGRAAYANGYKGKNALRKYV